MDSKITYSSMKEEIDKAKEQAEAEIDKLQTKKRLFINEQTFTGRELIVTRNAMMSSRSSSSDYEPNLYYVLEKILEERN